MAQSLEAAAAKPAQKQVDQSFLGKAGSELVDFGEGLFHGAIENPIDGVVQIANHVTGAHLPELHIVDEQHLHSAGGILGNIAGTAIDIYAASVLTVGIFDAVGLAGAAGSGAGVVGSALRLGAVGAGYSAVFQPTDANSKTFFQDRAVSGAVGGATFAAMGGAGALLDSTGMFAVPAARSLAGSLTYGGITGIAGGVANAEGNALKNGQIVPKLSDLATDVGTYAAFGLAFAGAGYAYNQFTAPEPRTFTADNYANVTVQTDAQGTPVKVQGVIPARDNASTNIGYSSTKLTNGNWSSDAWHSLSDGSKGLTADSPNIDRVQIDGNKATLVGDGLAREINDGGTYNRFSLQSSPDYDDVDENFAKYNRVDTTSGVTSTSHYDNQMRLSNIKVQVPDGVQTAERAGVGYGSDGDVKSLSLGSADSDSTYLNKQPDGSWNVFMNNQRYTWNGDVKILPRSGVSPEQIQLTPANGSGPAIFNVTDGVKPVGDMLQSTAAYNPGATGRPVVTVDDSGRATLTGGSGSFVETTVNDQPVAAGKSVAINPGDKVVMTVDISDRQPEYSPRTITWGKAADGTPVFGNQTLKPGTAVDFDSNRGGWVDETANAQPHAAASLKTDATAGGEPPAISAPASAGSIMKALGVWGLP